MASKVPKTQGAILKLMSTGIVSHKVKFLIKCLVVALDEVDIQI